MIKFHRPFPDMGIMAGAEIELDRSTEDMFVRQNYAEYVDSVVVEEKPKKSAKKKVDNAHVEGAE